MCVHILSLLPQYNILNVHSIQKTECFLQWRELLKCRFVGFKGILVHIVRYYATTWLTVKFL
jgi:hypothetical protein